MIQNLDEVRAAVLVSFFTARTIAILNEDL